MKKRVFALIMCFTVLAGSITGCGNSGSANPGVTPSVSAGQTGEDGRSAGNTDNRDFSAFDKDEQLPSEEKISEYMASIYGDDSDSLSGRLFGRTAGKYKTQSSAGAVMTEAVAEAENTMDSAMAAPNLSGMNSVYTEEWDKPLPDFNTEEYNSVDENGFQRTSVSPLSTFAADVDTGSYSNLRRMINEGYRLNDIPSGAVRVEEMLNYFDHSLSDSDISDGAFSVKSELGDCPWNKDNKLLMMTVQANRKSSPYTGSNYVFLIDTSGSMSTENKIDLAITSFKKFANTLTASDKVSVVTYSGSSEVLLENASGTDESAIDEALDKAYMQCYCYGGGTNGSGGIEAAYKAAEKSYIEGGNNRVIIASDGDMNLGISDQSGLVDLITKKKESGIFLTTLGFGNGNYSDANMEQIADAGNGNYYYIDCMNEAKRVLCEKAAQSFITVAKDVKFQLEFNPAAVDGYRLVGYENRKMAAEDFKDDTKDGGEVGAGAQVTVMYELVLKDSASASLPDDIDLKYQDKGNLSDAAASGELCTLAVRYKEPAGDIGTEETYPVFASSDDPSADFLFSSAVAEAALVITDSQYKDDASISAAAERAASYAEGDKYKEEFAELMKQLY